MMSSVNIEMVDLFNQYNKIKPQVDNAIQAVINSSSFIKGDQVRQFEINLGQFVNAKHVISCGNGTDALQIALMSLDLELEDEIIIPAFTYAATAEVIALLGLKPVMVDVDKDTFNISVTEIEKVITPRTRAIIPVHLFGLCADMEPIMQIAKKYNLIIIEDNAQSLGAETTFSDNLTRKTGTIGHIGCTSFFPTKNLGCFGDGGAIFTDDDNLEERIRMISNHGQRVKYYHSIIGCNSRLDTLQAAILNVKLSHLDEYLDARKKAAAFYNHALQDWPIVQLPKSNKNSLHTYNQYTLIVKNGLRDELKKHLADHKIPTMIYYPLPLYKQDAFKKYVSKGFELTNTEDLCKSVLSIPMHTEFTELMLYQITTIIKNFYHV